MKLKEKKRFQYEEEVIEVIGRKRKNKRKGWKKQNKKRFPSFTLLSRNKYKHPVLQTPFMLYLYGLDHHVNSLKAYIFVYQQYL